jgi:DNA-binding transcriptional ArsR family regulator
MKAKQLDAAFKALGDSTRRSIVMSLSKRPMSATDLAAPFEMSNAAISQHLKVLREAGLVEVRTSGTFRVYSLSIDIFEGVDAWIKAIESNWNESVDKLEGVMAKIEEQRRLRQK